MKTKKGKLSNSIQDSLVSIKKKKGKKNKYNFLKSDGIRESVEEIVPTSFTSSKPKNIVKKQSQRVAKVKKVPKIRRHAEDENVEDNFIIVPWASREEWEAVCCQFHEHNYKAVIGKIGVWQKRVPALPVGVEATLFLLEAVVYDEKFVSSHSAGEGGVYTEDQARSLYSLAIIRYLNHVSQLATQSLGESSNRLTRELASIVDTPDWLVSLRNEVSHGASAPSIEVLRMGGNFVLQWLKEKYWKLPGTTPASTTDPFVVIRSENETDAPSEISELLASYVAARIYKMRGVGSIRDPEIIRYLPNYSSPVKTKVVVITLRNSLRSYLLSHPSVFCAVLSQELIPSSEFHQDFISILNAEEDVDFEEYAFEKLFGIWMPIIKVLESKGKLIQILNNLCEIIVNPEYEKMWSVTARWIDRLLEIIEDSGKKYAKHLVRLLGMVLKVPNSSMNLFLERFFRLTEPRLGVEKIQSLRFLASIWLDDRDRIETKKRRKHSTTKFFTLNDIEAECMEDEVEVEAEHENASIAKATQIWSLDERGEHFWRNIPLGAVL